MRTWKQKWWAVALAGGVAACGGPGEDKEVPDLKNAEIQSAVRLEGFESCSALEQHIENTAVNEMSAWLDQYANYDGYYGGWGRGGDLEAGAPQADSANAGSSAGPTAHTTTNTQVAGVDEADFVKNDGTRIYVLSGKTLYLNESWPADQLKNVSKVDLEGWPREMFLTDDKKLVVFSGVYSQELNQLGARLGSNSGATADVACADTMYCGYYWANTLKITTLDVSNLAAPAVIGETYLPGSYLSSRRIGNAVRIVTSDWMRYPTDLTYWINDPAIQNDAAARKAAYAQLKLENAVKIRARSLSQWLPASYRKLEDGSIVDVGYECGDFFRSNAPEHLGLVSVATFNLAQPAAAPTRAAVLANASVVYASGDALYLASPHWWFSRASNQKTHTYLHKFDISQPDRASYLASGGVDGTLQNQFQLDEFDGHLRVATTVESWSQVGIDPWNWTWNRFNQVSVLRQNGPNLAVVGKTGELAQGESIFATRFVGHRGFVVTYRQVDPLFTLDLSVPSNPRVVGELKIPGFSTYLHPVDANHLIGIGEDRDENGSWSSRAMKISLYDVSDLANPREKFKHVFGTYGSYSTASHDHKAFNYFPEKKLLAVPFSDWSSNYTGNEYWSRFTSDLRVFSIDATTGITPKGALSLGDVYQYSNYYNWNYYWQPMVQRSVMADDFVYAIGDAGIRVANINNLASPLATVQFQAPTP